MSPLHGPRSSLLGFALLLASGPGCARGEAPVAVPAVVAVPQGPTIPLRIGEATLSAEVADTDAERQLGLMHRDGLAPDHGMVFVYPDERPRGFWMRNTRIPLAIAFLDAQGRIVSLAEMAPFDERTTPSGRPAMYAVEMEQGWFQAHGVKVGAKVEGLPGPSRE